MAAAGTYRTFSSKAMQFIAVCWTRQKEITATTVDQRIVICSVSAGLRPDEFLNLNIVILPISRSEVLEWIRDVNGYLKNLS